MNDLLLSLTELKAASDLRALDVLCVQRNDGQMGVTQVKDVQVSGAHVTVRCMDGAVLMYAAQEQLHVG
ncbi:hypothetical protein [Deinococcus soli (ex Cha et al. 2016)]|uniref:Uncharacterized protein n=2 Tax=Deinococcus soli (ex Cha et al. 2016) TaxID=1309411 RepID=A0AAE3XEV4_9DEIO|nr:hypothetical protein [Deinococcus soli (ex Cha et al. 2016)]MDR6218830.1 hypothetical protein [Deinococcus soli (ex Cha et al. 2016)]MDR6328627.1 hypothetical protein [Deinococcus soli (ex Cha et al. 2016)]MDR6751886.1 hypothetical protein [Deinococcus soli (ex Cha et al. 2016)]